MTDERERLAQVAEARAEMCEQWASDPRIVEGFEQQAKDYRAIAALLRAPSAPEGWRLVPLEQTNDMIVVSAEAWAASKTAGQTPLAALAAHWHANLAAAPQPKEPTDGK